MIKKRSIADIELILERGSGTIPITITCNKRILAVGAEMHSVFAYTRGESDITISEDFGNTSEVSHFERWEQAIRDLTDKRGFLPELIVRDLHPGFETSRFAEQLARKLHIPIIAVQHHRAHAAGVALEHGIFDYVAIASDGVGYGDDETIWGGEIFDGQDRIGHLEPQLLLGGDSVTRYPHKMLFSILRNFLPFDDAAHLAMGQFTHEELRVLERQRTEQFNSPRTTSTGRVFDAAAALLGLCDKRANSGEPAISLDKISTAPYDLTPTVEAETVLTTPLFRYLVENRNKDKGRLAATVAHYLAQGFFDLAYRRKKPIVFSGGCAYNRIMTEFMRSKGVLFNREIPPGDGGISFGQIASVLANPRNDVP